MTPKRLMQRYNNKYRPNLVNEATAEHFLENHLMELLDLTTEEILEEFDRYLSEIRV